MKKSPRMSRLVEQLFIRWYGLPVSPTHYYCPMPDLATIKARSTRWLREYDFSTVELDPKERSALFQRLAQYRDELPGLPPFAEVSSQGFGPGYGEVESQVLYEMLRLYKPAWVVEVGSGVSTVYSIAALRANRDRDNLSAKLLCIEPHPTPPLEQLSECGFVALRVEEVQETPLAVFEALGPGDVLFIDSTHTGKIDSDVYRLYLEILPRLSRGVVIHSHDILFPYLTLHEGHPLFDLSLLWNESALVKALLTHNSHFRVLMCQSYLHFKDPDSLREVAPLYDPVRHMPASLWLEKVE